LAKAVILAVDDGEDSRAALERELTKRYGVDYEVVCLGAAGPALQLAQDLGEAGRPLALVLVDQWMSPMTGIELLTRIRALHPMAKRAVLGEWGDQTIRQPVIHATALGQIDAHLPKPLEAPDEQFHRPIVELLEEWSRALAPGFVAVRIVGEQGTARCHELRDLLGRNGVPYEFCAADSADGRAVIERTGPSGGRLPLVVLHTGEVLVDPPNERIARTFGVTDPPSGIVDVAVVGAGPAGLGAAVYASSEGLSTVMLDRDGFGGQAGTSSMIRNYLGFPRGVSGAELARRAFEQAWLFGAQPYLMRAATGLLTCPEGYTVTVSDGAPVTARSVVIATGVSYRRLAIPSLEALVGAGVFYGAAVSEAQATTGRQVFVAGGGNSAGQAALHLARYASRVTILVRSSSLSVSMSEYLVREIDVAPNVEVAFDTEVVDGHGGGRLEALDLRKGGTTTTVPADSLFVLIGSEPRTGWLPEAVARDDWGFVVTGADLLSGGKPPPAWPLDRPPLLLETSLPGVFAAGDVRHRSVKRVASAVGDGAVAIQLVHVHLDEVRRLSPPPPSGV
jgi:thioredoxin reductase (NADPH)